jgi:hypothetical protein
MRSKAELDQFSEGFEACGVLTAIKQNPDMAREFFTIKGHGRLTTGRYNNIVMFSPSSLPNAKY